MRALLDINVLLALLDADHVDHARARAWLASEIGHGWASCALTQNGFVRIISQPRYPSPVPPTEAMRRLLLATGSEYHAFWPCDVSLLDPQIVDRTRIHGPRQVTDIYLLALAASKAGRFVTFDRSVPLEAVPKALVENLVVL
ncbi:MAG: VapC toxin family PIN domain ribonuclease [FCB group bacterium]|nr:VapC toxin family PIN domain ribonuclease [FCB group bacterium]